MLDISINLDHSHLWGPLYPTNNINRIVLQECGDFTWRESDCEELVGSIKIELHSTKWAQNFPRAYTISVCNI